MKLTGYVHLVNRSWKEPAFELWSQDMTPCGPDYVLAGTVEVEWSPPAGFDPRPQQIATLRQKQKEILAEAQAKATNIEEQIQRLQAIEFKGEA